MLCFYSQGQKAQPSFIYSCRGITDTLQLFQVSFSSGIWNLFDEREVKNIVSVAGTRAGVVSFLTRSLAFKDSNQHIRIGFCEINVIRNGSCISPIKETPIDQDIFIFSGALKNISCSPFATENCLERNLSRNLLQLLREDIVLHTALHFSYSLLQCKVFCIMQCQRLWTTEPIESSFKRPDADH